MGNPQMSNRKSKITRCLMHLVVLAGLYINPTWNTLRPCSMQIWCLLSLLVVSFLIFNGMKAYISTLVHLNISRV